jgi:hypothetical protein
MADGRVTAAPTCDHYVATALQRLRRHTPMQSAAALSVWLLIVFVASCIGAQTRKELGKENMVNMPPRKRFSEAQIQKVVDEKN